jgi:hypothetical protein
MGQSIAGKMTRVILVFSAANYVFIYDPKIKRFDVFRIIFWSLELKTHPSFA